MIQRNDYAKHSNSVVDARNFSIDPRGGLSYRSGTKYIQESRPRARGIGFYDWEISGNYTKNTYGVLAYSPTLNRFVICPKGANGTKTALYSDDGEEWIETDSFQAEWEDVIWLPAPLNRFLAVSNNEIKNLPFTPADPQNFRAMVSNDGINWFPVRMPQDSKWSSLAFSQSLSRIVCVSADGTKRVATSPDGINWVLRDATEANEWRGVVWADFLGKFFAVSQTGTNKMMSSADGITWSAISINNIPWRDLCVAEEEQVIVIVSNDSGAVTNRFAWSTNGTAWNYVNAPSARYWEHIAYSPNLKQFVVAPTSGSDVVAVSKDKGLTWYHETLTENQTGGWKDLIWSVARDRYMGTSSVTGTYSTNIIQSQGDDATLYNVKIIPFVFSKEDSLVLEFSKKYIRFIKNDNIITKVEQHITNITKANPAVVTYSGINTLSNKDRIILKNIVGMVELNFREFSITSLNTSNQTFELVGLNSTGYTTYESGGDIHKIIEVETPYLSSELEDLKSFQSNDVLYLTHPNYQTRKLSRTSDTIWTLTKLSPTPPPTAELSTDLAAWASVDTITYSGTTATATVSAGHGVSDKMFVTIKGSNQDSYNGTFKITKSSATVFTYTMLSTPIQNASGDLQFSPHTLKPKKTTGSNIAAVSGYPVFLEGDIGRNIIYGGARATISEMLPQTDTTAIKDVTTITHNKKTATVTTSASHGYSNGDLVTIYGADQNKYNGTFKISNITATTFEYTMSDNPKKSASGDSIICYKSPVALDITSITRSGTEATVTTASAHGYSNTFYVKIEGANEPEYNGNFYIYDVTSTTFVFDVDANATTPATGTMRATLKSPTNIITMEVIDDFPSVTEIPASYWTLDSSPQTNLTFPKRGTKGTRMTGTAELPSFRPLDVGKYIRSPRSDTGTYATFEIIDVLDQTKVRCNTLITIHKDDNTTIKASLWYLEQSYWSDARGWPTVGVFHDDRLWLARGATFWASKTGDYETFDIGTKEDSALQFTILSRELNDITWFDSNKSLIVGTTGAEYEIGKRSSDEPITPTNISVIKYSNYGSYKKVNSITTPVATIFTQRSGYQIMEFTYDFARDGFIAGDLTIHAEHLFKYKITSIAYVPDPIPTIWATTELGELLSLTYLPYQEIKGWLRHATPNGYFEQVISIPSSEYEQVYCTVIRNVNGTNRRYLERLMPISGIESSEWLKAGLDRFVDSGGSPDYKFGYHYDYTRELITTETNGANLFFVDSGIIQNDKTATTKVTGLWHLDGMEVTGIIDNVVLTTPLTVVNGAVTLPFAATKKVIGLAYRGMFKLLKVDAQMDTGTSVGLIKRVISMIYNIYASSVFKVGETEATAKGIEFVRYDSVGTPTLFTGDAFDAGFIAGNLRSPTVTVVQDSPLPLTVLSVVQEVEIATK